MIKTPKIPEIPEITEVPFPDIPQPIQISELFGIFQTVTTAPTVAPTKLINQIQFYTDSLSSPTVYKLYFYSTNLKVWKSVALT